MSCPYGRSVDFFCWQLRKLDSNATIQSGSRYAVHFWPLRSDHIIAYRANAIADPVPVPFFSRPKCCPKTIKLVQGGAREKNRHRYQTSSSCPDTCLSTGTGTSASLGTLGGNDLLAVLVVADTWGRSTVATADTGADTIGFVLSVDLVRNFVLELRGRARVSRGGLEYIAAKVLLSRLCRRDV